MEIKEVIEHCKSGNQIAQGILFNAHYQLMYNLSMRILANHHDVEDVLSIAFTKAFNGIQRFEYRGDHSLVKWIKTIVINESIRHVNGFLNIGYRYNLSKTVEKPNWLGVELGYLVNRHGDLFGENTFKLGVHWEVGKYISVSPQLYFSDEIVYPAVRIGFGL